ncbi:MAG TPA: hypothetical protein VEC36_07135 [Patescibacteria group bacterium]|nr:hypothetical protein [Patescibacteria group bacterium]
MLGCFFCTSYIFAQPTPQNNFSLLEALASRAADSVALLLKSRNIERSFVQFQSHPANWLLKEKILQSNMVRFLSDTNGIRPSTEILLKDFAVRYFPYPGEADSLMREGQIILSLIINSNTAPIVIPNISFKIRDFIARNDILFLEESQHSFTRAPVPPHETTFWDEYGEPFLFIAAAVITLALLFTVRSQ